MPLLEIALDLNNEQGAKDFAWTLKNREVRSIDVDKNLVTIKWKRPKS
jgi:hypothetical protein